MAASKNAAPASLSEAMERRGMSDIELAFRLEVTPASAENWRERRNVPHVHSRRLMAKLFRVPVAVVDSWFADRKSA